MRFGKEIILLPMVFALLAVCLARQVECDTLKDQVNVFGIQLFSDVDYREINGVKGVEEPCLKGYERSFDALDIIIGYGFDNKVRKITTRNPNTSLYGVKPGMTYEQGKQIIVQSGFTEHAPPFTFRSNRMLVTFLVDDKKRIFGLKLESMD